VATLIDSSVLITVERRGQSPELLADQGDEASFVAAITIAELLFGLHRAQTEQQKARRQAFIARALSLATVVPFDLAVAEVHARIWAELVTAGQRIGAHDTMIAATALAHGHSLLTENVWEFSRVPGLVVRSPGW
jgi:predicted nucleic acid-binding protein